MLTDDRGRERRLQQVCCLFILSRGRISKQERQNPVTKKELKLKMV